MERLLDGVENLSSGRRDVAREVAQKGLFGEASFIAVVDDPGGCRRRRVLRGERSIVFTRVRCPRGDIDKCGNLRMHSSLGKDHAGERVTYKHGRPVLLVEHARGGGGGFGQGRERILDGCDIEALRLESTDHFGPTGAVREETVHHDDVTSFGRTGLRGGCWCWSKDNRSDSGNKGTPVEHGNLP